MAGKIIIVGGADAHVQGSLGDRRKIVGTGKARQNAHMKIEGFHQPRQLLFIRPAHGRNIEDIDRPVDPVLFLEGLEVVGYDGPGVLLFFHEVSKDTVVHRIVRTRHDLRLEALAVDGDDLCRHLLLQPGHNAVKVIPDEGRHATVDDDKCLRPELALCEQYGIFQLCLATRDDIGFVEVGVEPYQSPGLPVPQPLKCFRDTC
ncbi:MAG: hypothetical protein A4E57_03865 [Syntrophorhabdaceae bacterium PtaU1.Bin034]|nr:MAG: hypothetical protein A4E57_03865 [Syntrophorhabdaceae bacterium PtaU1.Bin034]